MSIYISQHFSGSIMKAFVWQIIINVTDFLYKKQFYTGKMLVKTLNVLTDFLPSS